MDTTKDITAIEVRENSVKIGRVVLDSEALDVLDDIQTDLGDSYMKGLRRVSDLLLHNCEDLPVEYGEALHLLQMLSNLRRDIWTLAWAVNPLPPDSVYRRRVADEEDSDAPDTGDDTAIQAIQ